MRVALQIKVALGKFLKCNQTSPLVWISFVNSVVLLHDFNKYWMQKHVFRDIKGPYIKILTQPSKWSAKINKSSPSNKKVALRKKAEINNCRGYYYSVGKSS